MSPSLNEYITIAIESVFCAEDDPSLCYATLKIKNEYKEKREISSLELERLHILASALLKDQFEDENINESDKNCTVPLEWIKNWAKTEDLYDAYGGNGTYDLHLLSLNNLMEIFRMIYP